MEQELKRDIGEEIIRKLIELNERIDRRLENGRTYASRESGYE